MDATRRSQVALSEDFQAISSTRIRQCRAQGLSLPSPPNPPLYQARRHILERLFQEGLDSFAGRDMRNEASMLAGSLR